MLTRLQVSNIALIDKSDIVFDAGFSVLTGETGAGLVKDTVFKRNSRLIGPEAYPIVIAKNVVI